MTYKKEIIKHMRIKDLKIKDGIYCPTFAEVKHICDLLGIEYSHHYLRPVYNCTVIYPHYDKRDDFCHGDMTTAIQKRVALYPAMSFSKPKPKEDWHPIEEPPEKTGLVWVKYGDGKTEKAVYDWATIRGMRGRYFLSADGLRMDLIWGHPISWKSRKE